MKRGALLYLLKVIEEGKIELLDKGDFQGYNYLCMVEEEVRAILGKEEVVL